MGTLNGADPLECDFLEGDQPGEYSCRLVIENPELAKPMAIGAGCSSTLCNVDREEALKREEESR